jgi:phosphoribosylformylglycinamidine cyclo-ligase
LGVFFLTISSTRIYAALLLESEQKMNKTSGSRYSEAGVDIDKGNEFVNRIKDIVFPTFKRGVLTDIGGFGGLFSLSGYQFKDPVLISSTDGVGTKLSVEKL